MVLVADLNLGECFVIDSLHHEFTYPTLCPIMSQNVHPALQQALQVIRALALRRGFVHDTWRYTHVPCPQQPLLSNDCVVFTAYNIYCFAMGAPLCTPAQAEALRTLWLPALFGCKPRKFTPHRGRAIQAIPVEYPWSHQSTLYAFQLWCRSQSPPAPRPPPVLRALASEVPHVPRSLPAAPATSAPSPKRLRLSLPTSTADPPLLSAPPSPIGAQSPTSSFAQSESSDEELLEEPPASRAPSELSALASLDALQLPAHAPQSITPMVVADFSALLEFLAPRTTTEPTFLSPQGVWVAPLSLTLPQQQSAYLNAYTNWRAGLSPEVMATIVLAKRALFAFQDLPGAWLLIGLDRMDNHNPFVFAVAPSLAVMSVCALFY